MQLTRVQEECRRAYDEVPFYERRWAAAGFEPSLIQTLDDINLIPIYDIDDIRESIAAHPPYGDYQGVSVKDAKYAPLRVEITLTRSPSRNRSEMAATRSFGT